MTKQAIREVMKVTISQYSTNVTYLSFFFLKVNRMNANLLRVAPILKFTSGNFDATIATIKLCHFSKKFTKIHENTVKNNNTLWCFTQNFLASKSPPAGRDLRLDLRDLQKQSQEHMHLSKNKNKK